MEGQGGVYYAHLLDIGTTWLRSYYLPDLFDPSFEQQCLQIAEKEVREREGGREREGEGRKRERW